MAVGCSRDGGDGARTTIVAGAILAIQGALKAADMKLAKPKAMRKVLVDTGTPQLNPGTSHIGPLPRINKALNKLLGAPPPDFAVVAGR